MYWGEINGSWGSSVVCRQCAGSRALPLRLSWWTACFPMLKRTCLNRSLGCLNLCLSVRKPPVMSFLPTTSVSLQAPFLLCRLDNSIAKTGAPAAHLLSRSLTFIFQVTGWFICLLTRKLKTDKNISEILKLAYAFLGNRNACACPPPWMDYKHSCCVSTSLFLSKCFISVSIFLPLVMQWICEVCLNI